MERLNKFIASTGYCSRRKADELIAAGKVKVNGKVVKELGTKINPEKDKVEVEGKILKPKSEKLYYKLYKPRGYLTALGKDKFGKKTLTDLFKEINFDKKAFPVGRLDYDSEGLLILTNDGDLAYKLSHPKFKVSKEYLVEVQGRVNTKDFQKMKKGTHLEDGFFKPDFLQIEKKTPTSTWLKVIIHSGKKRILRRYFKKFGYPVKRLIRKKVGKVSVEDVKPFQIQKLTREELEWLKRSVKDKG